MIARDWSSLVRLLECAVEDAEQTGRLADKLEDALEVARHRAEVAHKAEAAEGAVDARPAPESSHVPETLEENDDLLSRAGILWGAPDPTCCENMVQDFSRPVSQGGVVYRQCKRKRKHGRYCLQHAKEKGEA